MNENYETIDLTELINLIKKHLILIILVTLGFGVIAGLFTKYGIDKEYSSNTVIYVNSAGKDQDMDYNTYRLNQIIANDVAELVKRKKVIDQVITELGQEKVLDYKQVKDSLSVNSINESNFITIEVTLKDPNLAAAVANKVADLAKPEAKNMTNLESIEVFDKAEVNKNPVSPNLMLNTAIGVVLGLMISVGYVLLREFMDKTIRTSKDVERYLDLPILGELPKRESL
ncbi:YveK family protein [Haloplasma contractile]|uniref:Chainlength regulator Capsular polysaccharide biosynthesis protein n=1 Tax=Haloplasma contractile SSD-17B TaxID=1033810 RepID=U2E7S5_9MOLU|nr:Wzz/FepE/Etk N-terminal domain-containing protein [Haloplasma contractile]ERJ10946.1 Chainlength regulator Capsular polysaccharide biosynthesis protein [Haloplasma contractile SSD-17B]